MRIKLNLDPIQSIPQSKTAGVHAGAHNRLPHVYFKERSQPLLDEEVEENGILLQTGASEVQAQRIVIGGIAELEPFDT